MVRYDMNNVLLQYGKVIGLFAAAYDESVQQFVMLHKLEYNHRKTWDNPVDGSKRYGVKSRQELDALVHHTNRS